MRNENVIFPTDKPLASQARELLKDEVIQWGRVRRILSHATFVVLDGVSPFAIPAANQDGNLRYTQEEVCDDYPAEDLVICYLHIPLVPKLGSPFAAMELRIQWYNYPDQTPDTQAILSINFKLNRHDPWSQLSLVHNPANIQAALDQYCGLYHVMSDDVRESLYTTTPRVFDIPFNTEFKLESIPHRPHLRVTSVELKIEGIPVTIELTPTIDRFVQPSVSIDRNLELAYRGIHPIMKGNIQGSIAIKLNGMFDHDKQTVTVAGMLMSGGKEISVEFISYQLVVN